MPWCIQTTKLVQVQDWVGRCQVWSICWIDHLPALINGAVATAMLSLLLYAPTEEHPWKESSELCIDPISKQTTTLILVHVADIGTLAQPSISTHRDFERSPWSRHMTPICNAQQVAELIIDTGKHIKQNSPPPQKRSPPKIPTSLRLVNWFLVSVLFHSLWVKHATRWFAPPKHSPYMMTHKTCMYRDIQTQHNDLACAFVDLQETAPVIPRPVSLSCHMFLQPRMFVYHLCT